MTIQTDDVNPPPHVLHDFDSQLEQLHGLVLDMTGLVMKQLLQVLKALETGEIHLAQKILLCCEEVNHYQLKIDSEVLEIIARHAPVANDLHTIISTAKIAVELQYISEEIYRLARLITVFYYPKTIDHDSKPFADIVKIGDLIRRILGKLRSALKHRDSIPIRKLLQNFLNCDKKLQEGFKHQVTNMKQNPRLIARALDVMQMMKALERCSEHCRTIAEHLIFSIEGIDVRHKANWTQG